MKCHYCHKEIGAQGSYVIDEIEGGSRKMVYYHIPCYKDMAEGKKRWTPFFKSVRLLFLIVALTLTAGAGMFFTLYVGEVAQYQVNRPCFVKGYVTTFCQRLEGEDKYVWYVQAERNGDVVVLQYVTSKLRKVYL